MVVTGSNTVNYAIIVDTTNLDGTATVANNYIVPTGIAYGWNFFGQYDNPDGSYNGTVTSFNNINMATGASIPKAGRLAPPYPALRAALQNDVRNVVVARVDNYLAELVDSYFKNDAHEVLNAIVAAVTSYENDVHELHNAIVATVTSYENDVHEAQNAIVGAVTSYENDVREVRNAIVGAVTRYENEVHKASVAVVTSYEDDVHEVHNAIVGAVTGYENEVHNAIVAALTSHIASSFAEANVSHIANSNSDASRAGNQPLLTNPHHA